MKSVDTIQVQGASADLESAGPGASKEVHERGSRA